jgi:type IV pilus biogenesis protein CpaD/CtpE
LLAGVIGTGTVVLAKSESGASLSAVAAAPAKLTGVQILRRLLLIQDEAKVDSLLAKAVADQKLTADQSAKVKTFWTNNHAKAAKFVKAVIARRILRVQNEANLKAGLDKAVASSKLTPTQEANALKFWETYHK